MPVKIIPLGGLGEFGLNSMIIEHNNEQLLIDCGIMFPDPSLGVDCIIPDFQYLTKEPKKLSGIILTHGHEDHIGGVPFLIRQCPVPVYTAPFTAALLRKKLEDAGIKKAKIITVPPLKKTSIGSIGVEFLPVSHSIPDSCAVALYTSEGVVIHSGDFKIDSTPFLNKTQSINRFKEIGRKGVTLLLSDSTNIISPGKTEPESSLTVPLENIFRHSTGRIIVGLFSSHIQRIQHFVDIAKKFKRKIVFDGRSLKENVNLAARMKYLKIPHGIETSIEDIDSFSDKEVLIIATGTQGEHRSALHRMISDEHPHFAIKEGDTLLHSARTIPGNELSVGNMFDMFYRKGARVIDASDEHVHVSGHGKNWDLTELIKATKPNFFVPIHGEYRYLAKHAESAKKCGLSDDQIILMENGNCLSVDKSGARVTDNIPIERLYVEGASVGDLKGVTIRTRRQLARGGLVIIVILQDADNGSIITGPHIISRGVIDSEDLDERIKKLAKHAITNPNPEFDDPHEEVRIVVRRLLEKHLSKRPLVVPLILKV